MTQKKRQAQLDSPVRQKSDGLHDRWENRTSAVPRARTLERIPAPVRKQVMKDQKWKPSCKYTVYTKKRWKWLINNFGCNQFWREILSVIATTRNSRAWIEDSPKPSSDLISFGILKKEHFLRIPLVSFLGMTSLLSRAMFWLPSPKEKQLPEPTSRSWTPRSISRCSTTCLQGVSR